MASRDFTCSRAFPLDFRIVCLLLVHFIRSVNPRSEVCWDKFDMNYRNQCLNGHWQQRFYFDHASLTCRQFWFDGCRSDSRNMFEDSLTCQWLCEAQPMYKSRACLEDFDENYKKQCNGGRWRQQWYFDRNSKQCVPFWYDGCRGDSQNIFQEESSCRITCADPASKDPRKPWHNNDKHKMVEALAEMYKPNTTDQCVEEEPCENGGTCIWVWKKNTYYCKCPGGYTGTNCEQKIDNDPCAKGPCLNGATCKAKVEKGKTSFECFCASGFGGPTCNQKPCEVNPCLNNGTCRTTSGYSTYFCDCREGFGGKNCDIAIGSSPPEERYGSQVELVSSGKEEWVQQMKERLGTQKKPPAAPVADEPYKDPATKKREREEREKASAEEKAKVESAAAEAKELAEKKATEEAEAAAAKAKELEKKNAIPRLFSSFLVLLLVVLF